MEQPKTAVGSADEKLIIQGDHRINVRFGVDEVGLTHSSHLQNPERGGCRIWPNTAKIPTQLPNY